MYKAIRKIFFASIFVLSIRNNSNAQTYVLIPDANFATYLQGLIPSAMSGNSLNITSTLVTSGTKTIICFSQSISDLDGIQYFTSLTLLYCGFNYLTTLPSLPNSITTLDCFGNMITSLHALPDSLTYFDCSSNAFINLPTLPNSLTYLDCSNNSLTTLPALPNTLAYFNCNSNSITTLPALPNSLTNLSCAGNSLTALPTLPSSLTVLWCGLNSLTSLPTLPNSITSLMCADNFLISLPSLPNALALLTCWNNNISCFPVFPSSINTVDISQNPFNCLPNYVLPAMSNYITTPLCQIGNSNGCDVVGIRELNSINYQTSIFPNPNSGLFKIQIDNEIINGELVLINSIGQVVCTSKVTRGENKITSVITSSGLYQYIILQNKQPLSRGKLVIE